MKSILQNFIDKRVDRRINEIIKSDDSFELRNVPDSKAESEISSFILEKKQGGITRLSILDFVLNLSLPAKQVSRILEQFEAENRLTSVDA